MPTPNDHNLVRGNYGFYFILDQMLYSKPAKDPAAVSKESKRALSETNGDGATPGAHKSDQGLGWFGRIGFEPQCHDFIGFYFDTGLTYKGLFPTRGGDTLGVAFAYARLSSAARQAAIMNGSVGVGAEMVLEATYQAQINKWLCIQPDLQFIINPGGNQDLGNAVVIGGNRTVRGGERHMTPPNPNSERNSPQRRGRRKGRNGFEFRDRLMAHPVTGEPQFFSATTKTLAIIVGWGRRAPTLSVDQGAG